MIEAQFGQPGIALRTLELYTAATLQATLKPPKPPTDGWRALMDMLSAIACKKYVICIIACYHTFPTL
jgi:phosphoenolpyruvate carboxylase